MALADRFLARGRVGRFGSIGDSTGLCKAAIWVIVLRCTCGFECGRSTQGLRKKPEDSRRDGELPTHFRIKFRQDPKHKAIWDEIWWIVVEILGVN